MSINSSLLTTRLAAALLCVGFAGSTQAGLITVVGLGGVVDAASASQTVDITAADLNGSLESIFDLDVLVEFSKCGGSANIHGCTHGSGYTYNREIAFVLSNGLSTVNLVSPDTFSGQMHNVTATHVYDDEANIAVGGNLIQSGSYRPVQSLSAFDGQSALGHWTFTFSDHVSADPLVVQNWSLNITTHDPVAMVPEPSSLALLGVGIVAFGSSMRRKLKKKA